MNTLINEKVSVITVYNEKNGSVIPRKLQWNGRDYLIEKLGYHHKIREGKTLFHIFSVATNSIAFRLKLDTDTLHWMLEEVHDYEPSF